MGMSTTQLDQGNNETISRGVVRNSDGTFTALTYSESKDDFKTAKGAERWLARRGLNPDGTRNWHVSSKG
jgi:hypothetical protein